MSVAAAYVYKNGVRDRTITLEDPEELQLGEGEFVWIGLVEPDEAELAALQIRFGLHPLAVEDAYKAHQTPKIEAYGDQLFVVTRTAHLTKDRIEYGETAIFVGPSHIITVRHGSARAHTDLRAHLEAAPALLGKGVDYVLHALLDFVVDGYFPIVESIEDEVLAMERRALDAFMSREEVNRLFHLKRGLMRFKRVLSPMGEVSSRLEHLQSPCIDDDVRPYFRDVSDHVRRVENMVDSLREVITSVFDVSNLLEQQRQSAITRKLAAWAAILAVPTAVAGIYGMNFHYMPELSAHYGYPIVLACIAAACGVLFAKFKQSNWL